MKLRATACLAIALMAGAPAMAQDAKPKPEQAPGVQVERVNKLMVGDRAPELAISEWVKGEEVTGFEEGKVYVVEFWATWCGPCIRGMPHLSELQKEYKDKGVTILGVNIWDDVENVPGFMEDRGAQPSGDELMGYTVAIEKKIEGEDPRRNGEMAKNWMRAAGRNGIPSAFIVDQRGYVAWMGHPMSMDEPLERIVEGDWDLADAAKEQAEAAAKEAKQRASADKLNEMMEPIATAMNNDDMAGAAKAAEKAIQSEIVWDHSGALNYIAWNMVDPDKEMSDRPTDLALKIAKRASELENGKNPMILDTLAWAYYQAGDKDMAIETQTKAISMVSGEQKAEFEKALERMKH